MKLCACGCEKPVTREGNTYLQGHNRRGRPSWNKNIRGKEYSSHFKNGSPTKGFTDKHHTEDAKRRISSNQSGDKNWKHSLTKSDHPSLMKQAKSLSKFWADLKEFNFPKYLAFCKLLSIRIKAAFNIPNFIHWRTKLAIEKLRRDYNIPESSWFRPISYREHRFARSLINGKPLEPKMSYLTQHPQSTLRWLGDTESDPYLGVIFPVEEKQYGIFDGELRKLNHKIIRH